MKNAERVTERMRRGFASLDETERAEADCPSADQIWDGAHGRLAPDATRALALHLAACPSCAADWRLAMRSTERAASPAPGIALRRPRLRWAMTGAAAAAILLVGFFAVYRGTDLFRTPESIYRAADDEVIRSLVPDGNVLPRDDAVLRWTAAADGARYSVEIGRPDLTPLDSVYDLLETEYRIPPASLESVEPGGTVVWQVEARLPDGRRIVSEAFLAKIE